MSDPHWEKLKEIFHTAVALAPGDRRAYLDRACDGNASLREAVESLLKSQEKTGFVEGTTYQVADVLIENGKLTAGQTVGRYRILSLLGEGGMGQVYLAEDTKLHRRVAIKFLPGVSSANEQANRRLLREAQAAAKLDHPNICAVHEVAEENGRSFIVMPYVEGETLDNRKKQKPFELSESLAIAVQVADALAEAHTHAIIHRDIKPSNIIITPRGQAKVMDFGLAKVVNATADGFNAEASTQAFLTTPGTILGTVPYMSPEQVHGQPLDARTDIFSFGVVLYEMLTGHQLFATATPAGTISAILTKEPAPLCDFLMTCPEQLQRIVSKCLEKDRERRYQTMRDVVTDLETVRRECVETLLAMPKREAAGRVQGKVSKIDTHRSSLITRPRAVLLLGSLVAIAIALYAVFFRASRNVMTTSTKSVNSLAYDYYLRGKVKVSSEAREDNDEAIKLLEQAVAADSTFAPPYAELARAYSIKTFYFASDTERKKLSEEAEVNVEKALALNPDLAEGHFARGLILWTPAKRFPHDQAIQSYKRALALNPNLDEAHHQLALVYLHIGLLDKGGEEIQKALAINPSNTLARFRFGVTNLYRGKYEEALAIFNSTPLEKNPSLWAFQMATALFELGRTQEAEAVVDEYLRKYPKDEGGVGTSVKAMIQAKAGKNREAEETIQRAIEIGTGFGHFHHTAYNIASAYALMNKPAQAIKWLQYAADDGFPCYPLFENDRNLDNLHPNAQFIAFMTKQRQQWEKYKASL
jgi:serine/threonine protein kinase/Flp pilus assembly protein TadD